MRSSRRCDRCVRARSEQMSGRSPAMSGRREERPPGRGPVHRAAAWPARCSWSRSWPTGRPRACSLSELARALGTSKSTTLALARTLVALGYLRDTQPGPRLHAGHGADPAGRHRRQAAPARRPVPPADRGAGRGDQDDLAGGDQRRRATRSSSTGWTARAASASTPRSASASCPTRRRRARRSSRPWTARRSGACAPTPGWPRAPRTPSPTSTRCWTTWPRCRRLGFAVDDEEDAEGVFCVGAAFFGHDGSCAGAVSVTGIKGDLPAWRIDELGRTVRRCADRGVRHARRQPVRQPRPGGRAEAERAAAT